MRWFRMYDDVLDDPKVQQLTPTLFKSWVNLLCLASKSEANGTLPGLAQIAFRLRMTEAQTRKVLADLAAAGLLDETETGVTPHNWGSRQRVSDDVAKRVAKHRGAVTRNVTDPLPVTSPDTDTDTERDTDTEVTPDGVTDLGAIAPQTPAPKPIPKSRPQRLPPEWQPGERDLAWAAEAGFEARFIAAETEKFRDHFTANGKPQVDWPAAWRNWLRRSAEFAPKVTVLRPNGRPAKDIGYSNEELEKMALTGELL